LNRFSWSEAYTRPCPDLISDRIPRLLDLDTRKGALLMSTETSNRQVPWFSNIFNAIGRVVGPRPSTMRGGSAKLQPISDILSRTGREPRSPE
jgi:hypothetical protein